MDAENMTKSSLSDMFIELEKETRESLSKLEDLSYTWNDTVDLHFQYVEEEIEIRVESIKIQLEEHLDKFKSNLKNMKNDFKLKSKTSQFDTLIHAFKNNTGVLRRMIQSSEIQNEKRFHEFEDNLKHLKETIKVFEYNFCNFKVSFKPSSQVVNDKAIGRVNFYKNVARNYTNEGRVEMLKENNFETIEITEEIREICALPNRNLLCAIGGGSLKLFDKNFKLIKELEKINEYDFVTKAIAVNEKNQVVYAIIGYNCKMLKMDFDLNLIKSYANAEHDTIICTKDDFVFTSSPITYNINILDLDFKHVSDMRCSVYARYMASSGSTLGVTGTCGVYFFDIATKTKRCQYNSIKGRINEHNSQFYVISSGTSFTLVNIFDAVGCLTQKFENKHLPKYSNNTQMYFVHENMFIYFYSERKLLKF